MTNPDNVGGLPKRTPSVVDVMDGLKREYPVDWENLDFYIRSLENKIAELCRAAPAGGDYPNEADGLALELVSVTEERDFLRRRVAELSAPAGSGEVSSLIERLESTARAYPEDVFTPLTDEQKKTYGWVVQAASAGMGRHMAPLLLEAAALLRKLQQGAGR